MVGEEKFMNGYTKTIKFSVGFVLATPLLIKSGLQGEFTDSSIEKTPDGEYLHINGYVWSSLLRRALLRLKGGEDFAKRIGKYEQEQTPLLGVSPLWCESSFINLIETDVRAGNKIDRKYGTASNSALYSDEHVPPGYTIKLNFNYFLVDSEENTTTIELFLKTLDVINDGIENIGGGWSYGLGRLKLVDTNPVKVKELDLKKPDDRKILWTFDGIEWAQPKDIKYSEEDKLKGWYRFRIQAKIAEAQLLAVHSNYPILDEHKDYSEMPDSFVYQRYRIEGSKAIAEYVIPGKTIRQALLSIQIERKLRTIGETICDTPSDICTCKTCVDYRQQNNKKKENSPDCACKRCKWFGNTEHSGIIAVSDAVIENADPEILHRVQLCEHSMQNIHLFSGEYLKNGKFSFDIWIDCSRRESDPEGLKKEVGLLLGEMKKDSKAPPGWYRMGATSTCTGQVVIDSIENKIFGEKSNG